MKFRSSNRPIKSETKRDATLLFAIGGSRQGASNGVGLELPNMECFLIWAFLVNFFGVQSFWTKSETLSRWRHMVSVIRAAFVECTRPEKMPPALISSEQKPKVVKAQFFYFWT